MTRPEASRKDQDPGCVPVHTQSGPSSWIPLILTKRQRTKSVPNARTESELDPNSSSAVGSEKDEECRLACRRRPAKRAGAGRARRGSPADGPGGRCCARGGSGRRRRRPSRRCHRHHRRHPAVRRLESSARPRARLRHASSRARRRAIGRRSRRWSPKGTRGAPSSCGDLVSSRQRDRRTRSHRRRWHRPIPTRAPKSLGRN